MISILIPTTLKTEPYYDLCEKSILENTTMNVCQIIQGANGEGTSEPQGQCRAVDRVAQRAMGDWLLITNNDMYFPIDWDRDIKFVADCFSPNLIEPTNNPGSAPPFLKLDAGLTLEEFNKDKVDRFMEDHTECTIENGFNLPFFIKKSLWEKIGGYDEMYDPFGSNSDSDLQYKLEIAGVTPKRHRGMLVYHFGGKSKTFTPENQPYWQKNWDYFIEKWGFEREDTVWEHNLHIPLDKLKFNPKWSKYA